MSLIENRRQRLTLLCSLYFAQGLPWGFMDETMINYLIDRGVGVGEAAGVSALILLPWTFKLMWAPLIDTITIRSMGRRRPWIITAQFLMAATLVGILMVPDVTADYRLLGLMFFIHNIFASFQDVSTDALAVDILPPHEQGKANGLMWASKLVGFAVGGAGFSMVMDATSIESAVLLQILILAMIMILPILWIERPGEKRFPWSSVPNPSGAWQNFTSLAGVGKNTVLAFSLRTTVAFLVFTLFHNIAPEIGKFMAKDNCINQLGWNYVHVSAMSGWAVIPQLFLVVLGGFLADRWGRRTVLIIGMTSYGLLALAAASVPNIWLTVWFPATYLILSPGLIGIGSVAFLAMAMRISWTAAAATVFTAYMTLSNVSAIIGKKMIAMITEAPTFMETGLADTNYVPPLTWDKILNLSASSQVFYLAALAAVVPLFILPLVRPADIDRAKAELDKAGLDSSIAEEPGTENSQESTPENRQGQ